MDIYKKPFFSIVVPTLNAAETLGTALESIAKQTFQNYEILLRDGGSTDGTLNVADRFSGKFGNRLKIVSQPDAGVYVAMNDALPGAAGRWLYFLGADDLLASQTVLESVVTAIRDWPTCQMLYGDVVMVSTNKLYAGAFDHQRICKINICHQAIFYRRELFQQLGNFDLAYPSWADWDFNWRCFCTGTYVIRYLNLVIAHYNDLGGVSFLKEDKHLFAKMTATTPVGKQSIPFRRGWHAQLRRRFENYLDFRIFC